MLIGLAPAANNPTAVNCDAPAKTISDIPNVSAKLNPAASALTA
jgi:hypothetical protein